MTPLEQYKAKKLEDFCKRFVVEKGGGRDGLGDPIPPYEELKEFDPAKYQDFLSQTIDELWALPVKERKTDHCLICNTKTPQLFTISNMRLAICQKCESVIVMQSINDIYSHLDCSSEVPKNNT